jgi:hypothetical protein
MSNLRSVFKTALVPIVVLLSISSLAFIGYNTQFRSRSSPSLTLIPSTPPPKRNVAIASGFVPHLTVYMPLAGTIQQVLNQTDSVRLYSNPLSYNYWDIVTELDFFHGPRHDLDDFFVDLNTTISDTGEMIDLVVLGTCRIE